MDDVSRKSTEEDEVTGVKRAKSETERLGWVLSTAQMYYSCSFGQSPLQQGKRCIPTNYFLLCADVSLTLCGRTNILSSSC